MLIQRGQAAGCNLTRYARISRVTDMPGDPFNLTDLPRTPLGRAALEAVRPLLDRALGLDVLGRLYRALPTSGSRSFETLALDALGIALACAPDQVAHLPSHGPLIVAANHPRGISDGLALAALVGQVRADVKILANYLLARVPEMRRSCFFVDPFGGPQAASRSRAGLRAAHLWLRDGGALIVFPAGEVAHTRDEAGLLRDEPWQPTVSRLALTTGATIVPAFILGENSALFYGAGRLHPRLRTALLGRELLRQRGTTIHVRLGSRLTAIDASPLSSDSDSPPLIASARKAVDRLARPTSPATSTADQIALELAALGDDRCLVDTGGFKVYCASAPAIPATLRELGRLREIAFRAVGEGTGESVDLDAFDIHYDHLVCWDESARKVVGAYRMGRTDTIVAAHGVQGLYTRTLFRYDRALVDRLGPALELGRAFVREEYQRHHNALLLLWKGIGRFVSQHPQYRVLFGPVSISARYSDASHALLMRFLEQNHRHDALAELVQAVTPASMQAAPAPGAPVVPRTAEEASRLVAALEPDGKGMPVLIRQYLKLNARVLAFNVDPHFGNALDALMTVDLSMVERAILNRYMGRDEAARFLASVGSVQAA